VADEQRAAEILRAARAERRGSSRALWVIAGLIGGICTIGFVLLLVSDRGPATAPERPVQDHGLGFGAGILVGAVLGVAIGFSIARQRQSSRNTP